jgi:hypothetical protein
MNRTFNWHFAYQIKNAKKDLMKFFLTYNEIYKILSFEKIKLITKKLLCTKKLFIHHH